MIPLQQIEVASPCHESWSEMDGEGAVRHCGKCARNVYNLSEMTTAQAQALVAANEGKLCVRFYRRSDGTMMTKDCPVGVRVARRRYVTALSWAASLAVASIVGTTRPAHADNPPAAKAFLGEMAAPIHAAAKTTAPVKIVKIKPAGSVKTKPPVVKPVSPLATMGRIAAPPPPKPTTLTPLMGKVAFPAPPKPPAPAPMAIMGDIAAPPPPAKK
ncbi:MAG: hypothetical protein ABIY70_11415 [Capsulimonas sp.]|uniref:hypothetical protein n=1 Tax=Capsulimonas sp. TaxID=2494211 RepID=UPI003264C342